MVGRKGEEAIRARELALQKMATRDFRSARKLAARAHRLSPGLDGLGQIILVCDVHCSDPKIAFREDERDWYKILGVGPTADEATVKRQYNRMALGLHPDKNRLPGATEAFSLVGRAKAILADSERRRAFDGRRKAQALDKSRNKVAFSGFTSGNKPGSSEKTGSNLVSGFQGDRVDNNGGGVEKLRNNLNFFQENNPGFLEKPKNILGFSDNCRNENPGSMDNPSNTICFSGFKNDNRGSQEKSRTDLFEKPRNNIGFSAFKKDNVGFSKSPSAFKNDNIGFSKFQETVFPRFNDSGLSGLHIQPGPSPVRRTITGFAAVQGNNLMLGPMSKEKIKKPKGQTKRKKTEREDDKNGPRVNTSLNCEKKLNFPGHLPPIPPPHLKTLEYSDSELNNFGEERAKKHFGQGQIWAIYDTFDAMPRFYALINKVISVYDFKVEITWLEPCPNNKNEKKWLQKGLPASCGKFRPGKIEIIEDHSVFSHLVKWKKDIRDIYHVYPRKGETWAIFKNWKMDWHLDPRRHMERYGLDFVEILSDYRAGIGVKIAFLGTVKGFSTLFCRVGDGRVVSVSDRFRFSHRVLSFEMARDVGPDGESRTFELDPGSLPKGFGFSEISSIDGILK